MLAELSGIETGGVICAMAFGAVGVIVGVIGLLKKQDVNIGPQPMTVELVKAFHEQFANKEDVAEALRDNKDVHEQIFAKIGGVDRGASGRLNAEVSSIYTRIAALEKSVGGLEAASRMQTSHLEQMDNKLDAMPDRVIATLRNTGAIGKHV